MRGFVAAVLVYEQASAIGAVDFAFFFSDIEVNARMAKRPAAAIAGDFVGIDKESFGRV